MKNISWKTVIILFVVAVILLGIGMTFRVDAKTAMRQMQENEKLQQEGNTMFSYSHPTLGTPELQYQFGNILIIISIISFAGALTGFWICVFTRN